MSKVNFKPGNMLYPLPAVMVSLADAKGQSNIITIGWVGTVNSDPPMVSISVRPERFSHHMLLETGEFVINLTNEKTAYATDLCGVKSGRDTDKWALANLHPMKSDVVKCPAIAECPVNIECRVTKRMELGSHDMFLAEVVAVHADDEFMDEKGSFHLEKACPITYSHGTYFSLGKSLGTFGYSVKK